MSNQTHFQTGFDAEVLMSGRYLQYLLLLAVDVGIIPSTLRVGGTAPITLNLFEPQNVDRTYEPREPRAMPFVVGGDAPLRVTILHSHPSGADLHVNVQFSAHREAPPLDEPLGQIGLLLKLRPETSHDASGSVLEHAAIAIELVDIDGAVVNLAGMNGIPTKDELLQTLRQAINRSIDLIRAGTGGRLQDIQLRKLKATETAPDALALYVNLRLKSGPHPDSYLGPRGDTSLAQNVLDGANDIVFGAGPATFSRFAEDAFHRRAKPDGSGFSHPITSGGKVQADIDSIGAGPLPATPDHPSPIDKFQIKLEGTHDLGPIPLGFDLFVVMSMDIDNEGLLRWRSDASASTGLITGLILHVFLGALAAVMALWLGPYAILAFAGLEVAAGVATSVISSELVDPAVDPKVDATLLDITPNRFTIVRRRWDPFFETHHQIGLRPGGLTVSEAGFALFGKAALTRSPVPIRDVVIRRVEPSPDEVPASLIYRVSDAPDVLDGLSRTAAAADRGTVEQVDSVATPILFRLPLAEATNRVASRRLLGDVAYDVKRVETVGNAIAHLLLLSKRETDEVRGPMIAAHLAEVTAQVTAEKEAIVRQEVLDEFAAQGIIATQERIDAETAKRLQSLIDAIQSEWELNGLPDELEAALIPLLSLESQPTLVGALQSDHLLKVADYDLVHLRATNRYYYRDHFDAATEHTPEEQVSDNLTNKPRFRSTPEGPILE